MSSHHRVHARGATNASAYTRSVRPIRGGLLSAVGGALLLLALSPTISSATYPGANGRIAYSGIFTVLPNGSGLQQLTSGGDPSWSADGRSIAFTRSDGEAAEVWTMHADGTHERQVTHDGVAKANPSFSPSGRRIVFSTAPYDREAAVFKIRPDGMKKRRIVGHLGPFATSPVFSPGGRRIAFEGAPITRRGRHLEGQAGWIAPPSAHQPPPIRPILRRPAT